MTDVQTIRLPDVDDDTNDLLNGLLKQLRAVTPRNEMLSAYYDMHRMVRQVSNVLPPMYRGLSLTLGWTAKGVDALGRRCVLTDFSWPDGDLDSLGGRELWDRNMLGSEFRQGATESLIHGPAFVVTTRGDSTEAPALIHFKSALDATGEWNARARRMDNLVSITDRDDQGQTSGLALYLDGRTIIASKDGGVWEVEDIQEHPWGVPADPMVYKPRLRRAFGSSRISRAARGLQDAAVRELLRLEGHMDTYSFPEMWMLGADESIFKDADGNVKPVWQVMLGRIKGVPDDQDRDDNLARADVKQFAASSPAPHLADLNALAKLFAREMSLPDTSLAITDVSNPTSAESYDASQYELIAEAEGTVDDWSPAPRRAFIRALAIQNGLDAIPDEWLSVSPRYRNPRFLSRAAEADAGMKQITAVPWLAETRVGLGRLGLTEQEIDDAMGERARAQGRMTLAQLVSGGTAPVADAV